MQVLFDKPTDELGVGVAEPVAFAERLGVHGTELRVIAAATFADVMVEPRDVEQFELRDLVHAVIRDRELFLSGAIAETPHVA